MRHLYWFSWFVVCVASRIYNRNRSYGNEHIPRKGGFLLASNHASFLDPIYVGARMTRGLYYMARDTLFRNPLFGALIRINHAIPVKRSGVSKETMKIMLEYLQLGRPFLVFPEGTRSRDGELGKLRGGIIRIAQMSGVPIVPCFISGNHRALGRGMVFPRPVKVTTRFGEPFTVGRKDDPEVALEELRKRMLALAETEN